MRASGFTLLQILASLSTASILGASATNPKCERPAVRKEWRALSRGEKKEWIRAVKCLNEQPHDPNLVAIVDRTVSLIPPITNESSYYDDLVYLHMDTNIKIHNTGLFLPWHRWYVQFFEDSLRKKCGFKGVSPYWDWRLDAADFEHNTLFDDDPEVGLGGWGDPTLGNVITTGAFANFSVAYPNEHVPIRHFIPQPWLSSTQPLFDRNLYANATFTPERVGSVIDGFVGDFVGFHNATEWGQAMHAAVHIIVGGDLFGLCPTSGAPAGCVGGPKWSPNDPLFWLHHGMIDYVWWSWQNKSPENFWAFQGGSVQNRTNILEYPVGAPPALDFASQFPADGLVQYPPAIGDVMDTTGGYLCYTYE